MMQPKVKQQLNRLILTMFMDNESWITMWKQWRKTHNEISEKYWEEDLDKYLTFAKLLFNLNCQKTPNELDGFKRMLLSVPKDSVYLSIKLEMLSLLTFMCHS